MPSKNHEERKDVEKFINLFMQLNDMEKGIIIGRMEAMVESKNNELQN